MSSPQWEAPASPRPSADGQYLLFGTPPLAGRGGADERRIATTRRAWLTRSLVATAGTAAAAAAGCTTAGQPAAGGPSGALQGTIRLLGWDQEPISSSRR